MRLPIVTHSFPKLRSLLLVLNPAFPSQLDVLMVHRRQCYVIERQYLASFARNENNRLESSESVHLASTLSETTDIKLCFRASLRTGSSIKFCARYLLHLKHKVHIRSIMFRLQNTKSAFYEPEIIVGIMERSIFHSRDGIVNVSQRLLHLVIIYEILITPHRFLEN